MQPEQLRDVLKLCGTLSDAVLQVAAWAWAALERRGVDLSDLIEEQPYLFRRVRDIARETLTVGAAMKFGGRTHVLDAVRKLPTPEQDRLVKDDRVPFVVEEDKQLTERRLHLAALDREQLKQLFNEMGEMRTVNQQIAYLSPSPATPPARELKQKVCIKRGKLYVPPDGAPVDEVVRVLRKHGILPLDQLT